METLENKGYKISEPIADDVLQAERREAGQMAAAATGMPEYKSAADFDARFSEMLRADEEKERARKEKEIQRKQIAQSMSDLGAVFGDVIKASGGALVTPRDVQAKYDALDKQTQSVYDNYRARMDAMRKGLQDNAAKDRDRALKAKEDAANRKWREDLYAKKKADDNAEAEKDRNARLKEAYARTYNHNYNKTERPEYSLAFPGEQPIPLDKAEGSRIYNAIFDYMIKKGIITDDDLPTDVDKKGLSQADIKTWVERRFGDLTGEQLSAIYEFVTGKKKTFNISIPTHSADTAAVHKTMPTYFDEYGIFRPEWIGQPPYQPTDSTAASAQPAQKAGRINRQEQTNTRSER